MYFAQAAAAYPGKMSVQTSKAFSVTRAGKNTKWQQQNCLSGYWPAAGEYVWKTVTPRCDTKVVLRLPRVNKIGIVRIA